MPELLNKYNIPVPRYTSYPTVPYWNEKIDTAQWQPVFREQFQRTNGSKGISLYIHLPFCESLCTYCGCNKKITRNHSVEAVYIEAVLQEWKQYRALMEDTPLIREIHLGGGTPTFFSPSNLYRLMHTILADATVHPDHSFSIEGHPGNTTKEHLETLYQLGFRRISYGVQDNDPVVQRAINRIQPFEQVATATAMARAIGYTSINFDLIYGLPFQTVESMQRTILQCISLQPERIAFYSYAHVPWTSRGQRLFDEHDLPAADLKMALYQLGKQLFTTHQYQDIGMDHFALPGDDLYKAWQEGSLHRNFMGYTTQRSGLLLGLGVSAISDAGKAFTQNSKSLQEYYTHLQRGQLPVEKGYFLTKEDELFRRYILDISCRGTTWFTPVYHHLLETYTFPELARLQADGLVEFDTHQVTVTETGRNFLRNICRAFDLHLLRQQSLSQQPVFSKAV